jgi:hypothetical protein
MTDAEALIEARRRWGEDAKVRHDSRPRQSPNRAYAVGYRHKSVFFICGDGDSWEDAFRVADRRPQQPPSGPSPTPQPPQLS